jgi:hypothetical protein
VARGPLSLQHVLPLLAPGFLLEIDGTFPHQSQGRPGGNCMSACAHDSAMIIETRPPRFDSDQPVLVNCAEDETVTLYVDYPVGDEPITLQW